MNFDTSSVNDNLMIGFSHIHGMVMDIMFLCHTEKLHELQSCEFAEYFNKYFLLIIRMY